MEEPQPISPSETLKRVLVERISDNRSYSLRAFARDLEISPAFLSQILNNQRRPSLKRASRICQRLRFDLETSQRFINGVANTQIAAPVAGKSIKNREQDSLMMEIDRFRSVSEWYHGAILEMTTLKNFQPNIKWLARRLGIPAREAQQAVECLRRLGLLRVSKNNWTRKTVHVYFPMSHPDVATRRFHGEMIDKAKRSLQSAMPRDYEGRDITGITMAVDPARLKTAKRRIATFRRQIMTYLSRGELKEVYQLNIQLFPLSHSPQSGTVRRGRG